MANPSLDTLFKKHVPSVIRESSKADFDDEVFLNLGHRVIDEYWMESRTSFCRHSTHRLDLERTADAHQVSEPTQCSTTQLLNLFMASEIEGRIEPGMTIEQRRKLAKIYRDLGLGFRKHEWMGHARYCFSQAAQYFGDLRLFRD